MSFTHSIEASVQTSGKRVSSTFAVTDGQEQALDFTINPSVTDGPVDTFDFLIARLKSIYILSDQDVTLETNSSSAPSNTIALKANKPLVWYTGSYFANPFTVDVTSLFFTTGAIPAAANIQMVALVDPTP